MGCCLQSERQSEHKSNAPTGINIALASLSEISVQFGPLDDLRSLEGVALLWTENMKRNKAFPANKLPLKESNSLPITGNNHKSIDAAPFTISTYFFVHSGSNPPNLLKSHTSPNYGMNMNTEDTPTYTEHNIIHTVIEEERPQPAQQRIHRRESNENTSNRIPTFSLYNTPTTLSQYETRVLPKQIDVHMALGDAMPNLALSAIPVFSNSVASVNSPSFNFNISKLPSLDISNYSKGLSLNDDSSFHIASIDRVSETGATLEITDMGSANNECILTIKQTVSNHGLFTLDNIGLTKDDFMEYDTKKVYGVGASGIVKKAFHFSSCKMVAIKQCRSNEETQLKAFEQEAKLYKAFKSNPHIIDIIGYGCADQSHGKDVESDEHMMALEFMDLGALRALEIHSISDIEQRERVVGYIAYSVLLALVDVHKRLYVHNDIKPENILVNKYGQIKLSDFGTVLRLPYVDGFLTTNNGTQRYQSPEKTIFDIKYNTKTDIWSLGITCYELLFGRNDDYDQMSYTTSPPHIDSSLYEVSDHCCTFINQCLNVNQSERPSAIDLLGCEWFVQDIKHVALEDKWPWSIDIKNMDDKGGCLNEDLFFMISALIIYYSTKKFNDTNSGSIVGLHRRVSVESKHKNYGAAFSDEQRIANMAKYALCSTSTVVDRIRVTVAYIKSQIK